MTSTKYLRKGSVLSIALKLLKESEKPMNVKDITKLVLEEKSLIGKTPYNTISAILQRSDLVTKIGKATYTLKADM